MKKKDSDDHPGVITALNKAINLKGDDPAFFVQRAEAFILLCDFQV